MSQEIVRGEYFYGIKTPSITFKKPTARLSASCLAQFPETEFVWFSIHADEKTLSIKPVRQEERNAVPWGRLGKPKNMVCHEFYRKVSLLMDWDETCRYKVFGKTANDIDGTKIVVFDLNAHLIYRPSSDGTISRVPEYPSAWNDSFGDAQSTPIIKRFPQPIELEADHE